MKRLFLLVALCTIAAAMVPKHKRAMEDQQQQSSSSTTTSKPICATNTPCGWHFYKHPEAPPGGIVKDSWELDNKYCICSANTTCQIADEDTFNQTWIKKCKVPVPVTP